MTSLPTDRESPAFLFLHVPGPHPPLVVDADGRQSPIDARALGADDPAAMGLTRSEYAARWESELEYLNRRVLEAVDKLQAADPNTVILVMADHGYVQEMQAGRPRRALCQPVRRLHARRDGLLRDAAHPGEPHAAAPERIPGNGLPESPDRYFLSPGPLEPLVLTEIENHRRPEA